MSSIRVFVVDDFEPFRQFVCATLGERNDLQIIGEAADGLEAVQKAVELKPDLILMDIGRAEKAWVARMYRWAIT
jgi:chemotaxis response regulator CheB